MTKSHRICLFPCAFLYLLPLWLYYASSSQSSWSIPVRPFPSLLHFINALLVCGHWLA